MRDRLAPILARWSPPGHHQREDGTVWDLPARRPLTSWSYREPLNDAAFAPDGTQGRLVVRRWHRHRLGRRDRSAGPHARRSSGSGDPRDLQPGRQPESRPPRRTAPQSCGTPRPAGVSPGASVIAGCCGTWSSTGPAVSGHRQRQRQRDRVGRRAGRARHVPEGSRRGRLLGRAVAQRIPGVDRELRPHRPDLGRGDRSRAHVPAAPLRGGERPLSPDGERIATGGEDGVVPIWDARSGAQRAELRGHTGSVLSLAWDAPGARLISASNDGSVRIWLAASGKALETLRPHGGLVVYGATFTPSGEVLTTGADDTIRLVDRGGRELQSFLDRDGRRRSSLDRSGALAVGPRSTAAPRCGVSRTAPLASSSSATSATSGRRSGARTACSSSPPAPTPPRASGRRAPVTCSPCSTTRGSGCCRPPSRRGGTGW